MSAVEAKRRKGTTEAVFWLAVVEELSMLLVVLAVSRRYGRVIEATVWSSH